MIPFLDLKSAYLELKNEIDEAVSRVLESGWYILGDEVEAFEREWAAYCGASFAVGVGSGLDALTLALRALNVGPEDEVIVPSNTYIATWLAVTNLGAKIVPVEPDPSTYNLNPEEIEKVITPRSKVILPVHLYGQPADLDQIVSIAKVYGIYVVEDAAQAHGAKYKGRNIGADGDIVCWSFYPGKNLGAFGDGGAITTNSKEISKRISLLRNYGSARKYFNEEHGVNSRLDPLQAAVLRVKLIYLDEWTQRRRSIAKYYNASFQDTSIITPHVPDWAEPAWHLYCVQTDARNELQKSLQKTNIQTMIHYPVPPHQQQAYQDLGIDSSSLPIASRLAETMLSLPIGPHLTFDNAADVVKHVLAN